MSVHARSSKSLERPTLTPAQLAQKKRRMEKNAMNELSLELFNHYNYRNQDTIIKLVKLNLEKVRKRIVQASHVPADYGTIKVKKEMPIFKSNALLAIPSIVLHPSLDEIQNQLNRAIQTIINVSKSVTQWTKSQKLIQKRHSLMITSRRTLEDENEVGLISGKNYLKAVLEHKDVAKLSAVLATSITSIKKKVTEGTNAFDKYSFIWEKNRETDLKEFLTNNPHVSKLNY